MIKYFKKTVQLACLSSVLAAGVSHAAPCDGYQIHIQNQMTSNLSIQTFKMSGYPVVISPEGLNTIPANSVAAFTLSNTPEGENAGFRGVITLKNGGKYYKSIFFLENKNGKCTFKEYSREGQLNTGPVPVADSSHVTFPVAG